MELDAFSASDRIDYSLEFYDNRLTVRRFESKGCKFS